ncbi:hypothetical protein B0H19DRAFT_1081034 [Mycena capillaripes]|nr:hypothetical protein B0H19DRAFT_1081034 [Mycena capillaripes]
MPRRTASPPSLSRLASSCPICDLFGPQAFLSTSPQILVMSALRWLGRDCFAPSRSRPQLEAVYDAQISPRAQFEVVRAQMTRVHVIHGWQPRPGHSPIFLLSKISLIPRSTVLDLKGASMALNYRHGARNIQWQHLFHRFLQPFAFALRDCPVLIILSIDLPNMKYMEHICPELQRKHAVGERPETTECDDAVQRRCVDNVLNSLSSIQPLDQSHGSSIGIKGSSDVWILLTSAVKIDVVLISKTEFLWRV